MKKEIALYKCMAGDFETIQEVDSYYERSEDYIRLTKPLGVEFVELPKDETIPQQVSYLDNEVERIQAEAQVKVNQVETIKAELLALPYIPEEAL